MTPKDPFLEGTFWDKSWRPIRSRALLFTPDVESFDLKWGENVCFKKRTRACRKARFKNASVRWSRRFGRRTSGTSRPNMGAQALALLSFIS